MSPSYEKPTFYTETVKSSWTREETSKVQLKKHSLILAQTSQDLHSSCDPQEGEREEESGHRMNNHVHPVTAQSLQSG